MSELHLYANGADPFEISLGGLRLVFHAGPAPAAAPAAAFPLVPKTQLEPPYRELVVDALDELDLPSDGAPLLVHLRGASGQRPRLDGMIAGLAAADGAPQVHLVADDV